MNQLHSLKAFIKHWLYRIDSYGLQAPFAYNLNQQVIKSKELPSDIKAIESLRRQLLKNSSRIEKTELGAGSKAYTNKNPSIQEIAKHSISNSKKAAFLYRLANYIKAKYILELGSCFGITSLFLSANKQQQLITIEGCPETAKIAKNNFKALKRDNIELHVGEIAKLLPSLSITNPIDLVFIDANHTKEGTLQNLALVQGVLSRNACIVIDDIHWSAEMEEAWQEIIDDDKIRLSIDFFDFGILFLNEGFSKQNLILKY